jgi:hypothetical protein
LDEARILIQKKGKVAGSSMGLFVYLGKDKMHNPIILDKLDSIYIEAMGIKKAAAGRYETACGKGYYDCSREEPPFIDINNTAIEYFKEGGFHVLFYWNDASKSFKKVVISD